MKICTNCLESKEEECFFFKRKGSTDRISVCKDCESKKKKEYYQKNKEKLKASSIENYHNNRERNLLRKREKWPEYYEKNKERILDYNRDYRERNRELCRERIRKWKRTPHGLMMMRLKEGRRRGRKKSTEDGTVTKEAIEEMIISQNYECNYCKCNLNEVPYHIDHIHPLSKGGPHSISNIQILCATCNLKKSNKI